jgi:hypothetical protein
MTNHNTPEEEQARLALRQVFLGVGQADPEVLRLLREVGSNFAAALNTLNDTLSRTNKHLSLLALLGVANDLGNTNSKLFEMIARMMGATLNAEYARNEMLKKESPTIRATEPKPGTNRPKFR